MAADPPPIPRLVIAAPSSGAGKSTLTGALAAALRGRGQRLATFKVGPDYLDPLHLKHLTQQPCRNLDTFLMGEDGVRLAFRQGALGMDFALVEGVMGLFDGQDPDSLEASTAHVSKLIQTPVVLVVDAQKMARSAAALIEGFVNHDPSTRIAGVIFNQVGSPSHGELLKRALAHVKTPKGEKLACLGVVPKTSLAEVPERHLGLAVQLDAAGNEEWRRWAAFAEDHLDVAGLLALARKVALAGRSWQPVEPPPKSLRGARVGYAYDEAFHFYYADTLERISAWGAQLVPFSPLKDQALPADLCALLLGGGYPELHADRLAANQGFLASLRAYCSRGGGLWAECGGMMYLGQALTPVEASPVALVGAFTHSTVQTKRLQALGYRRWKPVSPPWWWPEKTSEMRAHEFRYSHYAQGTDGTAIAWRAKGRKGVEGVMSGLQIATYMHTHFARSPRVLEAWLAACMRQHQQTKAG